MVPLLGLAGEAGTLLTEYKKWLREGESYQIFKERVAEELGDILWYVANIASKEELNLETIAKENLKKGKSRWLPAHIADPGRMRLFDEAFPAGEQLPRRFRIEFSEETCNDGVKVHLKLDGAALWEMSLRTTLIRMTAIGTTMCFIWPTPQCWDGRRLCAS